MTSPQTLQMAASVAEILAAVGVMISIIYLAVQVRQSNRQSRLQTHNDNLSQMNAPLMQMLAQPELARIIRLGGTNPDKFKQQPAHLWGHLCGESKSEYSNHV